MGSEISSANVGSATHRLVLFFLFSLLRFFLLPLSFLCFTLCLFGVLLSLFHFLLGLFRFLLSLFRFLLLGLAASIRQLRSVETLTSHQVSLTASSFAIRLASFSASFSALILVFSASSASSSGVLIFLVFFDVDGIASAVGLVRTEAVALAFFFTALLSRRFV